LVAAAAAAAGQDHVISLFSNWIFWLPHAIETHPISPPLYARNSLSPRLARPSALYRSHIKPEMALLAGHLSPLSPFPPLSSLFDIKPNFSLLGFLDAFYTLRARPSSSDRI
jgi:hypothetical protein